MQNFLNRFGWKIFWLVAGLTTAWETYYGIKYGFWTQASLFVVMVAVSAGVIELTGTGTTVGEQKLIGKGGILAATVSVIIITVAIASTTWKSFVYSMSDDTYTVILLRKGQVQARNPGGYFLSAAKRGDVVRWYDATDETFTRTINLNGKPSTLKVVVSKELVTDPGALQNGSKCTEADQETAFRAAMEYDLDHFGNPSWNLKSLDLAQFDQLNGHTICVFTSKLKSVEMLP